MRTLQDVQTWRGAKAVDANGDKVGKIEDIYLDRATGEPEWAAVSTGLFGTRSSFVPLEGADEREGQIRLAYPKDRIKDAPNVDADGQLSTEEERRLYDHYGRGQYEWSGDDRTSGLGLPEEQGYAGTDREGRFGRDDAMTRSEEELDVGTQRQETGRARLRKYVVTEGVQRTVPVQREEVRIEREPITDANADQALSGPELTEDEHEVTLHAEQPVVEKRTVPKERVRLEKDTVTDQETVSEEVRKEHIESEGDVGGERF